MSTILAIIFIMVVAALFVSLALYGSRHPMLRFDERCDHTVV